VGIGFEEIESPVKPIWVPVDGTSTLCIGQFVYYGKATPANTGGVIPMVAASGAVDVSNLLVPFGLVVGTNDSADSETYTTLTTANVSVKTITGVNTAAAQIARQNRGQEGMYAKGDPQPMVQVVRVTPQSVFRGYFRGSATVGTTVITTATLASGPLTTGFTTNALDFTPVADNHTVFGKTGTNAGLYRVGTGTSATALTFTREWPKTPAIGDTFKAVNVRQGMCRMNFDTTYGLWIDNTSALSSYYEVIVYEIDLGADPGNECCTFSFGLQHFISGTGGRTIT
jgi:hypothetical protein